MKQWNLEQGTQSENAGTQWRPPVPPTAEERAAVEQRNLHIARSVEERQRNALPAQRNANAGNVESVRQQAIQRGSERRNYGSSNFSWTLSVNVLCFKDQCICR